MEIIEILIDKWKSSSAKYDQYQLFHDGVPYHIETSPLIYSVNQWTGFYIIRTSVMKELSSILVDWD